jgi:hypothetical protein
MGRFLLLIACGLVAACEPVEPVSGADEPAHGELACRACHSGGVADIGLAAVPTAACTSSGCHATKIPATVELATARFEHRSHGSTEDLALGCAGCHTHTRGSEPLTASVDACALCHREAISGSNGEDCRTCHRNRSHEAETSQGARMTHASSAWTAGRCVRCHYDLAEPLPVVSTAACAACHEEPLAVTRAAIGADLHGWHAGKGCTACHEGQTHHIVAMSSAVVLNCADCHQGPHDLDLMHEPIGSETCNQCHGATHRAQQSFFLGLVADEDEAYPAPKFLDGLTCRSCHVPDGLAAERGPIGGSKVSCAGCHRPEYGVILDWWRGGAGQRVTSATNYWFEAREAMRRAGMPSGGQSLLLEAFAPIEYVREAGAAHNLVLAHELLEESVRRSEAVYDYLGLEAPAQPDLGRRPGRTTCSSCHYELGDTRFSEEMDEAFHRDVLGIRR